VFYVTTFVVFVNKSLSIAIEKKKEVIA